MFTKYILAPFMLLSKKGYIMKLTGTAILTMAFSPIVWLNEFLQANVFTSPAFAKTLFLLLFLDLILGAWKHLEAGTFNFKKLFLGFVKKVAISFIAMALFKSFSSVQELQSTPTLVKYLTLTGKAANLSYVFGSAFASMYILTGGKFPPIWFMTRLENFQKTLSLKSLIDEKNYAKTEESKKNKPKDGTK